MIYTLCYTFILNIINISAVFFIIWNFIISGLKSKPAKIMLWIAAGAVGLSVSGGLLFICGYEIFHSDIKENISPVFYTVLVFTSVLMFLSLGFAVYCVKYMKKEAKEKLAQEKLFVCTMNKATHWIVEQNENNRIFWHDVRNAFNMIQAQIAAGDFENAQRSYDLVKSSLDVQRKDELLTDNPYITILLTFFKMTAEEQNFKFNNIVKGSMQNDIAADDLVNLLLNIFQNAQNAISQLETNRYIWLELSARKNVLRITCRNPHKESLPGIRSKNSHGYGLKSVKKTVKKYSGLMDIKTGNGIFEIRVSLYDMKRKRLESQQQGLG